MKIQEVKLKERILVLKPRISQTSQANTMVADTLAPCITGTSAIVYDTWVVILQTYYFLE